MYQTIELIQIFWKYGVIDKSDLFPIYLKKNNWEPDPDCILPTGKNIRWLISVMEINQTDIDRMLDMHNKSIVDFDFLAQYKKFCLAHRIEPKKLGNIFFKKHSRTMIGKAYEIILYTDLIVNGRLWIKFLHL